MTTTTEADAPVVRNILIADDAFDSRQLLMRLLRTFTDAQVHEVRDGVAAAQKFQLLKPQITFLDIDMPGQNGMEVLTQIRKDHPKAFVVMVSGFGALARVQEAITLGIGGFVVKPYSPQRIVDVLRKYCADSGDTALLRED